MKVLTSYSNVLVCYDFILSNFNELSMMVTAQRVINNAGRLLDSRETKSILEVERYLVLPMHQALVPMACNS